MGEHTLRNKINVVDDSKSELSACSVNEGPKHVLLQFPRS